MSAHITSKLAIAFLIVAATFTSAATILDAKDQLQQLDHPANHPADRLIAHEWGTFTSISDVSGKAQSWNPLTGPSELPDFVHHPQDPCIKCDLALVRMETPVLYFYADRETKLSVNVSFPQGRITEWYPQARQTNRGINWDSLTVLPGTQVSFLTSKRESHYYPARETDAAPIRISDQSKTEFEKFLFYRGIGNFELPLVVKLAGDQVTVKNSGRDELAQVVLFENRGGRVGWRILNTLKGEATLARPALGQRVDQTVEMLQGDLEKFLVAQGLYEKEAAAMVKTWHDSWFEEGLRVFYIVPRKMTDAILPITITPAPTELTRVLIGRTEIITPEMEQAVQSSAKKYLEGTAESREAAIKMVQPYGRFAQPILYQMANDSSNAQRIWQFINAATSNPAASKR